MILLACQAESLAPEHDFQSVSNTLPVLPGTTGPSWRGSGDAVTRTHRARRWLGSALSRAPGCSALARDEQANSEVGRGRRASLSTRAPPGRGADRVPKGPRLGPVSGVVAARHLGAGSVAQPLSHSRSAAAQPRVRDAHPPPVSRAACQLCCAAAAARGPRFSPRAGAELEQQPSESGRPCRAERHWQRG